MTYPLAGFRRGLTAVGVVRAPRAEFLGIRPFLERGSVGTQARVLSCARPQTASVRGYVARDCSKTPSQTSVAARQRAGSHAQIEL